VDTERAVHGYSDVILCHFSIVYLNMKLCNFQALF
jgi:hypothetical protein